jgi:putative protease
MNIFVPAHNSTQLASYFSSKVNAVIFSTAFCSTKTQHPLTISELSVLSEESHHYGLPWYLSINRMILQSEWATLEQEIREIDHFDPTGFIVADLGVMHYLKKNYPNKRIIVQTDTTITNGEDFGVLLSMGADLIALAKELTYHEVTEIVRRFPQHVMISGFGYQSMSTSSRPLLTNYFDHINKETDVLYKRFTLQEEGRSERYPAMQDNHGFHIFADGILEVFDEVKSLEEMGLKHLLIDSLFIDDETVMTAIKTYSHQLDVNETIKEISMKYRLSKALYYTPTSAVKGVSE